MTGEATPKRTSAAKRIYAALAAVGVISGAFLGVNSLIDALQSRIDTPPPPEIDARIQSAALRDTGAPLGDYLRETNQPRTGYSRADLRQRGYVFNVRLRMVGLVGSSFPLRWALYRSRGERVRGSIYNQVAGNVEPKARMHRRTWPIWVPYPERSGTYFVRFVLENERHRPESEVQTRPFRH